MFSKVILIIKILIALRIQGEYKTNTSLSHELNKIQKDALQQTIKENPALKPLTIFLLSLYKATKPVYITNSKVRLTLIILLQLCKS